jgi:hypothetical protein
MPVVRLQPGIDWARGTSGRTNIIPVYNDRGTAKLSEIFKGYFDTFASEQTTVNIYNGYHKRVYVMCKCSTLSIQTLEPTVILESINRVSTGKYSLLSLIESGFIDKGLGNRVLSESTHSRAGHTNLSAFRIILPIEVGRKTLNLTIAYYAPQIKSLFTTNWTGSQLALEFVEDVIKDELVEKLHLSKTVKRIRLLQPLPIKLGCDPEFEIMTAGKEIVEARIFNDLSGTYGKIGKDASGLQLEFRPNPGSPDDVVAELETLFEQYYRNHATTSLCVSGHTHPLGGHIHVGIDRYVRPTSELLSLLDDFVGVPTVSLSGRARGTYKQLSYYESKNWGFEYRTPPAIIFYNPTLTRIVLKLIRNLVDRYINVKKDIVYNKPITQDDLVNIGELTENEARYYTSKLAHLRTLIGTGSVIEARWGKNVDKKDEKFIITFSDDWLEIIRTNFTTELQQTVGTQKINKSVIINFFGFKTERGLVSNIKIERMELISDKQVIGNDGVIRIGLPFSFRNDVSIYSIHKKDVLESVRKLVVGLSRNRLSNPESNTLWPVSNVGNITLEESEERNATFAEVHVPRLLPRRVGRPRSNVIHPATGSIRRVEPRNDNDEHVGGDTGVDNGR